MGTSGSKQKEDDHDSIAHHGGVDDHGQGHHGHHAPHFGTEAFNHVLHEVFEKMHEDEVGFDVDVAIVECVCFCITCTSPFVRLISSASSSSSSSSSSSFSSSLSSLSFLSSPKDYRSPVPHTDQQLAATACCGAAQSTVGGVGHGRWHPQNRLYAIDVQERASYSVSRNGCRPRGRYIDERAEKGSREADD